MKNAQIKSGVWPTMITPFTDAGEIDYGMVEKLIEWYIERGVAGIFAVCQSSEMFFLNDEEKVELAKFIVDHVNGRVGVVATTASTPKEARVIARRAAAGVTIDDASAPSA